MSDLESLRAVLENWMLETWMYARDRDYPHLEAKMQQELRRRDALATALERLEAAERALQDVMGFYHRGISWAYSEGAMEDEEYQSAVAAGGRAEAALAAQPLDTPPSRT